MSFIVRPSRHLSHSVVLQYPFIEKYILLCCISLAVHREIILTLKEIMMLTYLFYISYGLQESSDQNYKTPRWRKLKMKESVNGKLNITRGWNLKSTVNFTWFIHCMSLKLICILYNLKTLLLEVFLFSDLHISFYLLYAIKSWKRCQRWSDTFAT